MDVGLPEGKVVNDLVFTDEKMAEASVRGLYSPNIMQLTNTAALYITNGGVTVLGGLSADEMAYTGSSNNYLPFYTNDLNEDISALSTLWTRAYMVIYHANACIGGLADSDGITKAAKDRLTGECLFVRSFYYFYMVNLFGDVPLVTGTDYTVNATMPRTPAAEIYRRIREDLTMAVEMMDDINPVEKKVRPSKWTAAALLARVHLYQREWEQAEKYATQVLTAQRYALLDDLTKVFRHNSPEALWQISGATPSNPYSYTTEGNSFTAGAALSTYLSEQLMASFEPGDARKDHWVLMRTFAGIEYPHPYKYRVNYANGTSENEEGYMMMRYAEMYLVRAEAYARSNQVQLALADIDSLRQRAGLTLLSTQTPLPSQEQTLRLVEQERRTELFCEWGHRWLDLKRTPGFVKPALTRADEVLGPLKPLWKSTAVLFPIPVSQRLLNNNLDQNPGYN
ncbi:membrane protein [Chitinophaga cymbidii]|uniref:Membrane protein n=1 Tax=Chitinophaga cymbidii TaxID=1096750 RepID=A0A512RQV2_9BACT|nr:membrane protein [Chitinophaga cymbidii]